MVRHVPVWIVAVVTSLLLTYVVVTPDNDHGTAPSGAVSALMAVSASGGAARATRLATASSFVPAAATMRDAESTIEPGGPLGISVRGCRHQAPSRWAGGNCLRCLSLLRGAGKRLSCAVAASVLSSSESSATSPTRAGAERHGPAGAALLSLPQLQVFRC
ncbi:hypothetical protein AB0395_39195 [Streptosporangium sp. NPDC051023]|uniref:hypothetical protein n=1 Tax=Streptosporangium sp. NPDC051023 TaxID=3155410 RepID=UPI00344D275B